MYQLSVFDSSSTKRRNGFYLSRECPDHELHLASIHPEHSVEEVREHTGWDLKPMPGLAETPPPSREELAALHSIDKDGLWR